MLESIVLKIATAVRTSIRALGAATRNRPWLASAVVLALFLGAVTP